MLLILIVVLGLSIGYSALNTNLSISGEAYVRVPADVRITSVSLIDISDGKEIYNSTYSKEATNMFISLPNKDSYAIYEITITNNSNKRYKLEDIKFSHDVSYELDGIGKNEILLENSKTVFRIKISGEFFKENLSIHYKFSNQISSLLVNKIIEERKDFTKPYTETTNNKVFKNYDDFGTTYYFAGDPLDNYVSFAGYYWRIVRINGDGSIRLIYNGASLGEKPTISETEYSVANDDNTYVGYMYGNANSSYEETHANVYDSKIKSIVDTWYVNNLKDYDEYLSDSGFCVDRSYTWGEAIGVSPTTYSARNRLYENKNPSFKCKNIGNDLFTLKSSSFGNKALTYPIGLITADEVAFAGAGYNFTNENYYLKMDGCFWTMTPNHYNNGITVFRECTGVLNFSPTFGLTRGVRPVINLKDDVQLFGNGTKEDPYRVIN